MKPPSRKRRKRHTSRNCQSGKVRYRDQEEARAALRTIRANDTRRDRIQTRYYECHLCHGWHLTSQGRRAA